MEFFAQRRVAEKWATLPGGENCMHEDFGEGLRHGPRMHEPRGLMQLLQRVFPYSKLPLLIFNCLHANIKIQWQLDWEQVQEWIEAFWSGSQCVSTQEHDCVGQQ